MKIYYVEYTARLWVEADNQDEARDKANEITDNLKLGDLELNFPEVGCE